MFAVQEAPALLQAMRKAGPEEILLPLLLQLGLILSAARLAGWLFCRMGQPAVVGEIAAGLALGPSLLGWVLPGAWVALFRPEIGHLPAEASDLLLSRSLMVMAQLGLLFLLFLVGLEFDAAHLRRNGGAALAVSITGVAMPFALGVGLGFLIHPAATRGLEPGIPVLPFALFLGTALSITAIPVLGRMLLELGIARTGLAAVTLSAAAVDDAAGWVLLAAVAATAKGGFDLWATLAMAGLAAGFALLLFFAARPLLSRLVKRMLEAGKGELGVNSLAVLLVLLMLCAAATSVIGIGAVFGAFALGAALSGEPGLREAVNRRLRDFVTAFFLPLFFAYTGLRTDIGTLGGLEAGLIALAVLGVAAIGKLGGCLLASRWSGLGWRESACVGALMNTRGMMGLVAANAGRDLGVIPDGVFCALVLMSLLTTLAATPMLLGCAKGTELEQPLRESGFLKG